MKKIFNKKTDQVASLVNQARKIRSGTFIKQALKTIPVPPTYSSLDKKGRRKHASVHSLIDVILPIAAGSTSPVCQLELLKNRWKYIHKESLEKPVTWKTLRSSIENLSVSKG